MIGLTESLLTAYLREGKGRGVTYTPGDICPLSVNLRRWLSRGNVVISLEDTVEGVALTNGSVSQCPVICRGRGVPDNINVTAYPSVCLCIHDVLYINVLFSLNFLSKIALFVN